MRDERKRLWSAGSKKTDLQCLQVSPHIVQVCIHTHKYLMPSGEELILLVEVRIQELYLSTIRDNLKATFSAE